MKNSVKNEENVDGVVTVSVPGASGTETASLGIKAYFDPNDLLSIDDRVKKFKDYVQDEWIGAENLCRRGSKGKCEDAHGNFILDCLQKAHELKLRGDTIVIHGTKSKNHQDRRGLMKYLWGLWEKCNHLKDHEKEALFCEHVKESGIELVDPDTEAQTEELPDFVYEMKNRGFWFEGKERWISINKEAVAVKLQRGGVSNERPKGGLSAVDRYIDDIITNHTIDLAAMFSGYHDGVYDVKGAKILVPKGYKLVEPRTPPIIKRNGKRVYERKWSLIQALLKGMLGDEQYLFFLGHMKLSYEALRDGRRTGGPACFFVGPKDCGKVPLQEIIKKVLGGRYADPFLHMTGGSTFNDELGYSEVHIVDDAAPFKERGFVQKFGGVIKHAVAAPDATIHPKGKAQITLPLYRRIFFFLNPEEIELIPDMEESLMDKINLFQVGYFDMPKGLPPLPSWEGTAREDFMDRIHQEIPYFLDYLCRFKIDQDVRGRRWGQECYHHPAILARLSNASPLRTHHLVLQKAALMSTETEFEVNDLYEYLLDSGHGERVKELFRSAWALGRALGSLSRSDRYRDFYCKRESNGKTLWTLSSGVSGDKVPLK